MIAVILTGGKQYRVQEGDVLDIEKIGVEAGRAFEFSKVLLIADGEKIMVGTPFIANAGVRAEVLEHRKGDKVLIFKKKRRKQYRRFKGHRQQLVRVRVTDILPDVSQAPEKKPAPPAEKPEPRPTPAAKPVPAREAKAAPAKKPAKQAKPEKTKAVPKKATVKPAPKARKQK
ncbi:MAG: 50S ribosomal protein L21 [Candidatus Aminicenantes bacterium RBG_13_59_9]|nr:MAG: 50S ribosomal protein L21 [Candidatus Aminicenantes bacterium RBG_13_59_9]